MSARAVGVFLIRCTPPRHPSFPFHTCCAQILASCICFGARGDAWIRTDNHDIELETALEKLVFDLPGDRCKVSTEVEGGELRTVETDVGGGDDVLGVVGDGGGGHGGCLFCGG